MALRSGLTPTQILDLYLEHGQKIFPGTISRFWNRFIVRGIFLARACRLQVYQVHHC